MKKDVPISLFRFRSTEGIMAYCISTSGKKMNVKIEMLTPKGAPNRAYRVTIEPEKQPGKKITVVINPHRKWIRKFKEYGKKPFIVLAY